MRERKLIRTHANSRVFVDCTLRVWCVCSSSEDDADADGGDERGPMTCSNGDDTRCQQLGVVKPILERRCES